MIVKWPAVLAVLGATVLLTSSAEMGEQEYRSLEAAALTLRAGSVVDSSQALDVLFDAGERALPYLVNLFDCRLPFNGICGRGSLESSAEFMSIDEWLASIEEKSSPPAIEVREVALYLVMAVLKDRKHFAHSCRIDLPADQPDALSRALGEVAGIISQASEDDRASLLEEIQEVLDRWQLSFPEEGAATER